MRILINRKPVSGPWGGGNQFVKNFCHYFKAQGHEIVHNFNESIDLVFIQDPRYSDLGISINEILRYKEMNPGVRIVHRVNECDARKGTRGMDEILKECSKITDDTIFVSNWMKEYHESKEWHSKKSHVVYNGVDLEHFKKREKFNNGKINIVTHHWSDNPMKGADVYEFLDDYVGENKNYTFTYIGRSSSNFKNSNIIEPLSGINLGEELSKYDVYVSGSRKDPGPNHIIESIACQIPTFCHTEGGGALEFCGVANSFHDKESLISLLEKARKGEIFSHDLEVYSWKDCMKNLQKVLGL